MLESIGERDQSAFFALHAPKLLGDIPFAPLGRLIRTLDNLEEFKPRLLVSRFVEVAASTLTEG